MGSLPFAAREGEEDQDRGLLQFCSGNTCHHGHHPLISQVIYFAYDAENQLASRQVYNDHMRFPFFGGEIGLFSVFFFHRYRIYLCYLHIISPVHCSVCTSMV